MMKTCVSERTYCTYTVSDQKRVGECVEAEEVCWNIGYRWVENTEEKDTEKFEEQLAKDNIDFPVIKNEENLMKEDPQMGIDIPLPNISQEEIVTISEFEESPTEIVEFPEDSIPTINDLPIPDLSAIIEDSPIPVDNLEEREVNSPIEEEDLNFESRTIDGGNTFEQDIQGDNIRKEVEELGLQEKEIKEFLEEDILLTEGNGKKEETPAVKDLQQDGIINPIEEQGEEGVESDDISKQEMEEKRIEESIREEKTTKMKVNSDFKDEMENNLEPKMEASVQLSDEDQDFTAKNQIEEEGSGIENSIFASINDSSNTDKIETNNQNEIEAEVVLKETNTENGKDIIEEDLTDNAIITNSSGENDADEISMTSIEMKSPIDTKEDDKTKISESTTEESNKAETITPNNVDKNEVAAIPETVTKDVEQNLEVTIQPSNREQSNTQKEQKNKKAEKNESSIVSMITTSNKADKDNAIDTANENYIDEMENKPMNKVKESASVETTTKNGNTDEYLKENGNDIIVFDDNNQAITENKANTIREEPEQYDESTTASTELKHSEKNKSNDKENMTIETGKKDESKNKSEENDKEIETMASKNVQKVELSEVVNKSTTTVLESKSVKTGTKNESPDVDSTNNAIDAIVFEDDIEVKVPTSQKQPESSEESKKTSPVTMATPEELKSPADINDNEEVKKYLEENNSDVKELNSVKKKEETTSIDINTETTVEGTGASEENELIEDVNSEKLFSFSTSTKLLEPEIFTTELPKTGLTSTVTSDTTEAGNTDENQAEDTTTPPFLFTLLKQKFSNP